MSTYEDDHNIPQAARPSSSVQADGPSPYAARDAPRTFDEFMQELQRIVGAVRFGNEREGQQEVDGGGLMIDEDLYDELFGNMDAFGPNIKGASQDFIKNLPRVGEEDIPKDATNDVEQNRSCPICLLSYAQILTEQEYAEAADYHVGGNVEDMGLRRLPCHAGKTETFGDKTGHIVCGECAAKWLRLNNTCPLCRSIMDPSAATQANQGDAEAEYTAPLLQLFRSVFGHAREEGIQAGLADGTRVGPFGVHVQALGTRPSEDEEFNSMYS